MAVVVLALALLLGWLPHYTQQGSERQGSTAEERFADRRGADRTHRKFGAGADLAGHPDPTPQCAHLCARPGYLKARYVDLGDTVQKGQLLAVISAPDLDASVGQAAAALQQSKDNVLTAQSTLRLQQATYARVHTLVLHGILSGQDDDTARAAVESAQSNLEAMQSAVKGAQEALAHAQALADFEQVRSPDQRHHHGTQRRGGQSGFGFGSRTGSGERRGRAAHRWRAGRRIV